MSPLHSERLAELAAAAERCEEDRRRGAAIGFALVVALMGLLFLIPFSVLFHRDLVLEGEGRRATGTVTAVREYPGKTGVQVHLDYRFRVAGREYAGASLADRFTTGTSRIGDTVTVRYDPTHPAANHLDDPTAMQNHAAMCGLAGCIVLLAPLAYRLSLRLS